ncbi:MAG: DUF1461 domain-containing protein [Anaerolineales bacterium]|nr:DUF1461 domain-containing protein [Anaerolineales bacterium]
MNYNRLLTWIIILATPFFLGLGGIRLVIAWNAPSYPAWEYGRIPSDPYGFSDAERLALAEATLDYLRRPEPAPEVIHLLEDLRLPGTADPLYNEREIEHMLDVKIVADMLGTVAWTAGLIAIAGLAVLLARPATRRDGLRALRGGGIATVAVLVLIGLFILLAWDIFFVQFHELLFPPGSWTFAYTDSLIRLFPEQFWFDFGIIASAVPLISGALVALVGHLLLRRQQA